MTVISCILFDDFSLIVIVIPHSLRHSTFRRTTIATLLPFAFSRTGQDNDLIYDEDLEPVSQMSSDFRILHF